MATIVETYEEIKRFLLPGVYNLTPTDVTYVLQLLTSLIRAVDGVSVSFDLEDDKRVFLSQLKIIQKELQDLSEPIDPKTVIAVQNTNLFRLALTELGDALRWTEILELNKLTDPFLASSSELKLPTR